MINHSKMSYRDSCFGTLAGFIIGLLLLPVLNAAKPDFFNFPIALSIVLFFTIATPLGLFVAFLIGKKISVVWQVGKFGVTGVMNFLVDLGVLSLLIITVKKFLGIEADKNILTLGFLILSFYSIYKAISFIIANINSYFWNKFWTFGTNSGEKKTTEFSQFFVVSIIGFFINVFVASYVFKALSLPGLSSEQWGLIGAAAGSIVGLIWNFLGYKFIVFKK